MSDFFEDVRKNSELLTGNSPNDDQIIDAFIMFGPERRASMLQDIDQRCEKNIDVGDLPGAAKLLNVQRHWDAVHQSLLKVGR